MSQEPSHADFRAAFVGGLGQEQETEARVYVGLDASTSMMWFDKYALIAKLYPTILGQLEHSCPQAKVETWLFHRALHRFSPLAPVADAKAPTSREYLALIAGGSAIADCLAEMVVRAKMAEVDNGPAKIRVVLWTDGWNRLSRLTPNQAREIRKRFPEVEVHLIALLHDQIRRHFDALVAELELPEDAVFVFEHKNNLSDTQSALSNSAVRLLLSMTPGNAAPEHFS